jgi:hypothetical protein
LYVIKAGLPEKGSPFVKEFLGRGSMCSMLLTLINLPVKNALKDEVR